MSMISARHSQQLARGLGWFSIGLGLAEIFAPRKISNCIGVAADGRLMRLMGLRELVTGIGLVTQKKPAPWVWARVAGDALDLGLLGANLASQRSLRTRATAVTAAVAGVAAIDVLCGQQLRSNGAESVHFAQSLSLNCTPEEAYRRWKDFENLPRFMDHLQSVQVKDEIRSHWVARGPGNSTVEWDAEISADSPGELISWHSVEGSDITHTGSVRFLPAAGGRGTLVKVHLRYSPPAGKAGTMVAKLFGEALEKQIKVDLRRFKQAIETGEIATTEGQPAGRSSSTSRKYDNPVRV